MILALSLLLLVPDILSRSSQLILATLVSISAAFHQANFLVALWAVPAIVLCALLGWRPSKLFVKGLLASTISGRSILWDPLRSRPQSRRLRVLSLAKRRNLPFLLKADRKQHEIVTAGGHNLLMVEPIKPYLLRQSATGDWRVVSAPPIRAGLDIRWCCVGHLVREADLRPVLTLLPRGDNRGLLVW
jgi:hypothetical protein